MPTRKHHLGAKYSHDEYQEVLFLYKHFKVEEKPVSDALRKLHHAMFLSLTEQKKQSESSKQQHEELRLLEGWDCTYRSLIWPHNKYTKKKEPKIICSHPMTREILRTNELYIATCKKCHDTGGSANLPSLPEPKQQVSKPTPKAQQVQRLCNDCKIDISNQPSNHTLCRNCWFKQLKGAKAPDDDGHGEGLPGSSMQIGKQQAARLRKLDERMKQSKEE